MNFKIGFIIELILAAFIFLYPVKKRSYFPIRVIGALIVIFALTFILPQRSYHDLSPVAQFIELLVTIIPMFLMMWFCFDLKLMPLLSCFMAGYAVQHIGYHLSNIVLYAYTANSINTLTDNYKVMIEGVCCFVVYIIALLTVGRLAAKNQYSIKYNRKFNYISIAIVFICIGLTRTVRIFDAYGNIVVSLYAITSCILALSIQFVLYHIVDLQRENETINLLLVEKQRQYEISKKTINLIDIKYHDLKHKLRHMNLPKEEIDTLKESLRIYGSQIRTGNEPLDILLTENSLRCSEDNIRLTCMGNGADMNFMNAMDVYSLFGNAVENAIEAVKKLNDDEKKVIDIVIEKMGDMISIHITNFYNGKLKFEDDLPVSTKTGEIGFHGYGMKSMRLIAEKYNGNIAISTQDDLFSLTIYLMQK